MDVVFWMLKKAVLEKEKLLVASIFFFSHNVFLLFCKELEIKFFYYRVVWCWWIHLE